MSSAGGVRIAQFDIKDLKALTNGQLDEATFRVLLPGGLQHIGEVVLLTRADRIDAAMGLSRGRHRPWSFRPALQLGIEGDRPVSQLTTGALATHSKRYSSHPYPEPQGTPSDRIAPLACYTLAIPSPHPLTRMGTAGAVELHVN